MTRETKAQQVWREHFNSLLPPKPKRTSDRNYLMMRRHLVGHESYEDISFPYQLDRRRVKQIVERGLEWAIKEQQTPRS